MALREAGASMVVAWMIDMSKSIPSVRKYMTTTPRSIGGDETIATASKLLKDHEIRHLPVLEGERLLGVLTDRDIKFVEGFRDVDTTTMTVAEAMVEEPYAVGPDTPLDEVTNTMAEQKYGCALVVQNTRVVGIFTTVDACRALSELLTTRLRR
jgi:acetoin utilization protein AcuB